MKASGKLSFPRQWLFGILSIFWPLFRKQQKNLVVLTSFHGDGYRGNTKVLFETLNNHSDLKAVWLTRNINLANDLKNRFGDHKVVLTHSFKGLDILASAGAILLTHGTDDYPFMYLPRRAEIIQTYHGLPTKRGEYMRPHSENEPGFLHKIILAYRFSPINYFLSSSDTVTDIFSKRFDIDKENFVLTGYPAYDQLTNGTNPKNYLFNKFPDLPDYNYVILYAPTFRKKSSTHWFPFEDFAPSSINQMLDDLQAVLILRPHPNENLNKKSFSSFGDRVIQVDQRVVENVNDLLILTDCIVTDYSGIYIEGLLLDIPSVFIPYDLDQYERGLPLPYSEVTPGPKVLNQKEFEVALKNSLTIGEKYKFERNRVQEIYFANQPSNATEQTIRFLKDLLC